MERKQIITITVLAAGVLAWPMEAMQQQQPGTAAGNPKITVQDKSGATAQLDENIIDRFGMLRDMHGDTGSNTLTIAPIGMGTFKQLVNDMINNTPLEQYEYSKNALQETIACLTAAHYLQAPQALFNRYVKIIRKMILDLPKTPEFLLANAKDINELIESINDPIRLLIRQNNIHEDPINVIASYYARVLISAESLQLLYNNNTNFIAFIKNLESHQELPAIISKHIPQYLWTSRQCLFYSGRDQPHGKWPSVDFSTDGKYLIITDYRGSRTIIDTNTGQPVNMLERLLSTIEPQPNPPKGDTHYLNTSCGNDKVFERFVDWGSLDHKMTLNIDIKIRASTLDQQLFLQLLVWAQPEKLANPRTANNAWVRDMLNTFSESERAAIRGAAAFKQKG